MDGAELEQIKKAWAGPPFLVSYERQADVDWLISQVEFLSHQVEEYENPMACGHFGANNQPDDANNYFCMVCQEIEPLREENRRLNKEGLADALAEQCELTVSLEAQLAANDAIICKMRDAIC